MLVQPKGRHHGTMASNDCWQMGRQAGQVGCHIRPCRRALALVQAVMQALVPALVQAVMQALGASGVTSTGASGSSRGQEGGAAAQGGVVAAVAAAAGLDHPLPIHKGCQASVVPGTVPAMGVGWGDTQQHAQHGRGRGRQDPAAPSTDRGCCFHPSGTSAMAHPVPQSSRIARTRGPGVLLGVLLGFRAAWGHGRLGQPQHASGQQGGTARHSALASSACALTKSKPPTGSTCCCR